MGIAGDPGDDYHTIETPTKKLVRLRSRAISRLVAQVAETFSDSIDGVLSGDHPGDLVMQGEAAPALATVESVSRSRIYAGPERLKTDLLAHKVLTTLLHAYLSAFHERETKGKAMSSLAKNTLKSFPYADRVGNDKASYVRAVLDYVSGMTDAYAIDRAQLFASTR
jgi:dGTPase